MERASGTKSFLWTPLIRLSRQILASTGFANPLKKVGCFEVYHLLAKPLVVYATVAQAQKNFVPVLVSMGVAGNNR
jgi:hypothetical protein